MMERLQTWVVEMPEVSYQCITVSDCVSDCVSFSLVLSCCLSLSLCLFHSLSSCLSVTGWLKYQRCLSYSLFLHYACCYDEIKGTQDFKICSSHADSLNDSLSQAGLSVVVLQVKALAAQLDKWNPATADEMLKTIPSPWFKKLQVHNQHSVNRQSSGSH